MNDLTNAVAVFGKPYTITRSRLGAVTKLYDDKYICDIASLKEIFSSIGEKLNEIQPIRTPEFSFLISFNDKTHHDGLATDLNSLQSIPIGKQTDRVVMRWNIAHLIDSAENELSVTIRISNPINPLIFLQAALSKSPSDIDNLEFERGATCVTVDGAGQLYADEIFLRVQNWINARNKPHAFTSAHEKYIKYEWALDQLNYTLLPFLTCLAVTLLSYNELSIKQLTAATPLIVVLFFIARSLGRKLNSMMDFWARRTRYLSLFQLTNGDQDAITKLAAKSMNSLYKLLGSTIGSFILNLAAGIFCWWLTQPST